tara:strand:- start:13263 stop:13688 length:426 start_codon:yes stop_codon:yes gene_type:complete
MKDNMTTESTLHLVYARYYSDSETGEGFPIYSTIFRNVSLKHLNRLNSQSLKDKVKKIMDKKFNETAANFTGYTDVEMIVGSEYYQTYNDVFGDVATGDNSLFNDYGQLYNGRQGFKWDFNPKLTERYTYKNLNKQHKYNN